jgi:hypothetical protein
MQIRRLKISNFRGIGTLDWMPGSPFCCLIGAGDSGKSTLLDAAEAALSSRWFTFAEPDFLDCDTSHSIVVEATVGELSKALKSDRRPPPLGSTLVWSPIRHPKEIGREKALFRRADHRLSA